MNEEQKSVDMSLRPWWQIALEVVAWLAVALVFLLLPGLLDTGNKIVVILFYVLAFSFAVFGAFRPKAIRKGTLWWKHLLYCLLFAAMLCVFIVLIVAASFFLIRFL